MKYALVCLNPTQIVDPVNPYDPKTGVINYIMAPAGTVVAIILYDGVAPYTPPSGTVLKQVNDNINIGAFVGT